jgi:hypothetical protein
VQASLRTLANVTPLPSFCEWFIKWALHILHLSQPRNLQHDFKYSLMIQKKSQRSFPLAKAAQASSNGDTSDVSGDDEEILVSEDDFAPSNGTHVISNDKETKEGEKAVAANGENLDMTQVDGAISSDGYPMDMTQVDIISSDGSTNSYRSVSGKRSRSDSCDHDEQVPDTQSGGDSGPIKLPCREHDDNGISVNMRLDLLSPIPLTQEADTSSRHERVLVSPRSTDSVLAGIEDNCNGENNCLDPENSNIGSRLETFISLQDTLPAKEAAVGHATADDFISSEYEDHDTNTNSTCDSQPTILEPQKSAVFTMESVFMRYFGLDH